MKIYFRNFEKKTPKHNVSNYLLFIGLVFFNSCYAQGDTYGQQDSLTTKKNAKRIITIDREFNESSLKGPFFDVNPYRVSDFVRRVFQDKSGDLWFGTNGDGVVRFDGDTLEYYTEKKGFKGAAVRAITEDHDGNVWFATNSGITKYDEKSFTNYKVDDVALHNNAWSLMVDSKGTIWIGTIGGAYCFNGEKFTPFVLPENEPDSLRGVTSAKIVHCIMEDSKGAIWFGTNGGAYQYDGNKITNISEKEGLCNNAVNCILEDKKGDFWFATHHNGVCRYDGKSFTHFIAEDNVNGTEVWDLYEDRSGNIWFPVENFGVYRYDGESFTNFSEKDGLYTNAIQCTFEDKDGQLWFGGWKGLFQFNGESFVNFPTE